MESNIKPIKVWSDECDNMIKVNVDFTDKCNYDCPYCYNLKTGYKRRNIEVDADKLYDFLMYLHKLNPTKNIVFIFIGGEPTIHSQFLYLVQKLRTSLNSLIEINAFTNFSNTNEFYEETIKLGVKYLITFHYLNEYRTKYFIDKLEFLKSKDLLTFIDTINIMLQIDNFQKCLDVYDYIYDNYNNLIDSTVRCNLIDDCDKDIIKHLRRENYTDNELQEYFSRCKQSDEKNTNTGETIVKYSDNSIKKISDYELKNNISYNFKYWKCNAGLQYFHINWNGDILPCKMHNHKIGNIYENLKAIKLKPVICMSASCPCEYDIPKERIFN